MASKNKVNLMGNLGRDPELRYMPDGTPVVVVSLATNEGWKDKKSGERQEHTEWHRLVFFRGLAEIVARYLVEGSLIDVEGKLRTRKWTDQDGLDHYTTEIRVKELQLLPGKRREGVTEGDVPQGRIPTGEANELDPMDRDIPF